MAETTMIEDLIKLQQNLPAVKKDSSNPLYKSDYATIDAITEATFPIMTKYNFAWVTLPIFNKNGEPMLAYKLLHTSGQSIQGTMRLTLQKNDMQGLGSAITYARRYSLCSVLGIVTGEDDDGNGASGKSENKPASKKQVEAAVSSFGDEMISDKQASFLKQLMSDRHGIKTVGDAKIAFKAFAHAEVAKVHDLTKKQATEMIDFLNKHEQHEIQTEILKMKESTSA